MGLGFEKRVVRACGEVVFYAVKLSSKIDTYPVAIEVGTNLISCKCLSSYNVDVSLSLVEIISSGVIGLNEPPRDASHCAQKVLAMTHRRYRRALLDRLSARGAGSGQRRRWQEHYAVGRFRHPYEESYSSASEYIALGVGAL